MKLLTVDDTERNSYWVYPKNFIRENTNPDLYRVCHDETKDRGWCLLYFGKPNSIITEKLTIENGTNGWVHNYSNTELSKFFRPFYVGLELKKFKFKVLLGQLQRLDIEDEFRELLLELEI